MDIGTRTISDQQLNMLAYIFIIVQIIHLFQSFSGFKIYINQMKF